MIASSFLRLFISSVSAYDLTQDVNAIAGGRLAGYFCNPSFTLQGFGCGSGMGILIGILGFIWSKLLLIIGPIALYIIVKASVSLIASQADDKLQKARREIIAALVAVILAMFAQRFVEAFYFPGGVSNPATGVSIINSEVMGIISWANTAVVVVAIILIVASAIKVVASFGKEDGPTELRRTVFGVISGVFMLIVSEAIRLALGLPADPLIPATPTTISAAPLVARGLQILSRFLGFLSLVAVAILIYAGISVIVSFGNEENYTKARSLMLRVVIGLVIVFLSYAMTQFMLNLIAV